MANLIKSYHPHHLEFIVTFKDLKDWIDSFFSNKYKLYRKWDGISSSLSLNIDTKEFGIKRSVKKPPMDIDQVKLQFSQKEEALNCFKNLLDIVNNNKSVFNVLKLNLNPSLVLLIEYIEKDLNIIKYESSAYNIIGLSSIEGSILKPVKLDDSIYINLCNRLNTLSDSKFVYKSNIKMSIAMYKNSFYDELKKTFKIKNINLKESLYDILESNRKINHKYKNIYGKTVNTSSVSYYNKEDSNFSYGLAATEIILLLGEFIKKITKSQDIEGFIFYDAAIESYLKLVGNFITKLDKSKFNSKVKDNNLQYFIVG